MLKYCGWTRSAVARIVRASADTDTNVNLWPRACFSLPLFGMAWLYPKDIDNFFYPGQDIGACQA